MQIIKSQHNIVEKVLRDKNGRLLRARFSVYESAGRIKARLIDFSYIETKEIAGKILAILGIKKEEKSSSKILFGRSIFSPFVASEILYSTGSKPRAPTF